jgi:hypothetical protein
MSRQFRNRTTRRSFLQVGAATALGLSLADALQLRARGDEKSAPAKNVILIYLTGGPPTIDMWDMKPSAPERIRGEFKERETSVSGIRICEHMPKLAAVIDRVTLVRSVSHAIAEHTQGQRYVMTGNVPTPAFEHPSLGSLAAKLLSPRQGVPPYMTLGDAPAAGAGELGATCNPFAVNSGEGNGSRIGLPDSFTVADLERRDLVLKQLDQRFRELEGADLPRQLSRSQQQALDILRSDRINKALEVSAEPAATVAAYGTSQFGSSVLAARRLVEAGARFVTIGFGDWDTHANNFARLRASLLPQLDQGLAALLSDLHERGLLAETMVYCTGEFGRTPTVNAAAGRDHWARSMTALLAGGGIRGGFAYGATDGEGLEPRENACTPDDLGATVFARLGFEPEQQVDTRSGRPVALFKNGNVLKSICG